MRVLIVSDDPDWLRTASEALRNADVELHCCAGAEAPSVVAKVQPDTMLLRWPDAGGASAVEAACAADRTGALYVIAVFADEPLTVVRRALAAGVHDVVRDRYFLDEARVRIDARSRLWRWMHAVCAAGDAPNTLATLRAWHYLGDVVATELEAMLGCTLDCSERASTAAPSHAATIVLSFAAERFELCIRIGGDETALTKLGELLLGDPTAGEEARGDFLREMANAAGGAVKRSARPEHVTLTMGLPSDTRCDASPGQRSWSLIGHGFSLWLAAELRARENERLPANRLREGMVVVKDVRGATGMLLVAGGTRLTMTTAVRLGAMLGELTLVEVAAAA